MKEWHMDHSFQVLKLLHYLGELFITNWAFLHSSPYGPVQWKEFSITEACNGVLNLIFMLCDVGLWVKHPAWTWNISTNLVQQNTEPFSFHRPGCLLCVTGIREWKLFSCSPTAEKPPQGFSTFPGGSQEQPARWAGAPDNFYFSSLTTSVKCALYIPNMISFCNEHEESCASLCPR